MFLPPQVPHPFSLLILLRSLLTGTGTPGLSDGMPYVIHVPLCLSQCLISSAHTHTNLDTHAVPTDRSTDT
jgi:hypothetical protein